MPKFVWEISSKGAWRPQLFHGEMPREMTARENAHRYRVHDVPQIEYENAEMYAASCEFSVLDILGEMFPPPAPEPREIKLRIETETVQEITDVA